MLGAILAFASAGFFGLNNATVRRGVLKSTALHGMAITVPAGIPLFMVFAALFGSYAAMAKWPLAAWGWMVGAGIVHFVLGRFGNYRATQALGATLSTPIQQLSILVSLALASAFLGESVNLVNGLGILIILLGPAVVMRRRNSAKGLPEGFVPEYGPGLFWGFICALGYGASPLMIVLGLGQTRSLADSVGGVLVSYVAAAVVVAVLIAFSGGRRYMRSLDRGSVGWFAASAAFVALSQFFRYMALALAPVSVVVPIQRLSVVFRIIFNAMLNRQHEVLDRGVIAAILMSVLGAIALTADTRALLDLLGFGPDAIRVLSRKLY
ncbi:EamA family transporter [Actibacterium sp. MT2.3-13A]|uniref:DMT family transporter n=1 Tax=Actibacterium sp. MT2.3-13A TaxID=2828332 RepID=UPI001BA4742E|nr:EamA family transporter [Actibacterium sp. MT2.3-13A]